MFYNMKKFLVLSMVLLSVLSCSKEKTGKNEDNNRYDKLYCEFMSIDAYETEIELTEIYNQLGTVGYIMRPQLKGYSDGFLKKHRVSDEENARKEKNLADTLSRYGFRYEVGTDTYLKVIYGGISGPARVYADVVVDGRPAGDDISDLFEVAIRGMVRYPEMNLIINEHIKQHKGDVGYCNIGFREFFTQGTVPFSADYDTYLYPKEGYTYLIDGSTAIHIEIPVTGIDAEGQEKSVVLTGTIQH